MEFKIGRHMKILIVNGPNLNLLGKREPHIYGSRTFQSYFDELQAKYTGHTLRHVQSNCEGGIIDALHEAAYGSADECRADAVILNAGAYTHTSLALYDAIRAIERPVIEVHISNPQARAEEIRHRSLIAPACRGTIAGFGMDSYRLAIESLI